MSVTRIGKIALVLLFLAYLTILGETFRHRTGPTVSKEFPYLIFKAECCPVDSGPPESYWHGAREEGEESEPETVTESKTLSDSKSETKSSAVGKAVWSVAPTTKKFGQASETITYGPTAYSTVTTTYDPSPILLPSSVTFWSAPSYEVIDSPPVVSFPSVIVQRPYFQSFIP